MQRDRLPYLILPAVALVAILPLILHGCSCGHDFDFHLLSWMEAARQFAHGNLHPHWAFTPAFNAGEPRFIFYPPFSWTIGAILGLVFPWTWTPILYTWLALTAAGLSLYHLTTTFTSPYAAMLAAAFYMVNPYMLFTAYERTAYAELLAAAWIPLLLHAILRREVTIPRIAIPVALLWLTNAPAAVMSCYALALLTLLRLIRSESRLRLALTTSAGTLLGLGLAGFYLIPAAYERRYVQIAMAVIPNMRIQDNFLFHHTGDIPHDQVLHTASVIALILIALTAALMVVSRITTKTWTPHPPQPDPEVRGDQSPTDILLSVATLTIAITLLLTPLTAFVWSHAPELSFLQFPWRLLAILAALMGLAAAISLSRIRLRSVHAAALALAIAAALTWPAYTIFHQNCDDEDTVQARQALFLSNQGTDPTDEYTPVTADNDSLAKANPPYWLASDPNAKAPANTQPGPIPTHVTVDSPASQTLILNLRDYPSWHITLNQSLVPAREQRDDGLIAIPISSGSSTLAVTWATPADQTIGSILTLLSLLLLLWSLFVTKTSTP